MTSSEECPSPSEITSSGTWQYLASVAQVWRAVWNIHGKASNSEQV
ncbi:hypothetical protein [Bacteroides thetaiotaomicron]